MRRIDKFIGFLAVLAFAACESPAPEYDGGQPEPPTPEGTPISLQSGLMPMALGSNDLKTELNLKNGFEQGNQIGFFAKMNGPDAENILNLPLTLVGTTFDSEKLADINAITQFFAYYPYKKEEDISADGVSIYENGKDGKVIDFLTTDYAGNGSSMAQTEFYHTFAVVCIKCGNGFTHFEGDIYVQLKRMVKAVRIEWDDWTGGNAFGLVNLVYDDTAVEKKDRRFKTTKFTKDGETYWAAIIPCKPAHTYVPNDATQGGVTVDAIVLSEERTETETEIPVNNEQVFKATITENNSQTVTTGLRGGSIYNLELQKVGFEASVFPCKVSPWEDEPEIKKTLEAGINNEADFRDFVAECNTLFTEDKEYTQEEITNKLNSSATMQKFGTDVNDTFTVFLKKDIDFANTDFDKAERMTAVIYCLPIPIDGRGHTISNIRLNGGFCKTLRSTLKSLTFKNIRVVQPADSSDPVGMLADKMESGGTIEDCHVSGGWLEGNGQSKVGAAVGTMNAGTITGSSFAGIMIGETNLDPKCDGLVGEYTLGEITDSTNDMVKSTMQMGN